MDSWHGRCKTLLGNTYKVYDAKVVALLEGLEETVKSLIAWMASGIHICLDNFSVACNTRQIPKSSS